MNNKRIQSYTNGQGDVPEKARVEVLSPFIECRQETPVVYKIITVSKSSVDKIAVKRGSVFVLCSHGTVSMRVSVRSDFF